MFDSARRLREPRQIYLIRRTASALCHGGVANSESAELYWPTDLEKTLKLPAAGRTFAKPSGEEMTGPSQSSSASICDRGKKVPADGTEKRSRRRKPRELDDCRSVEQRAIRPGPGLPMSMCLFRKRISLLYASRYTIWTSPDDRVHSAVAKRASANVSGRD
jgi:hypothetical protein